MKFNKSLAVAALTAFTRISAAPIEQPSNIVSSTVGSVPAYGYNSTTLLASVSTNLPIAFVTTSSVTTLAVASSPVSLNPVDFISVEDFEDDSISLQDYDRFVNFWNSTNDDDLISAQDFSIDASNSAYREQSGSLFNIFRSASGTSDDVCTPYSSAFMPYTGFRFVTTSHYNYKLFFTHKLSNLVYCYQGKEVTRASAKIPFGKRDILWGSKYCFSQDATQKGVRNGGPAIEGCYVPARTARAHHGETVMGISWRRPERLYGGLFRLPKNSGKVVNDAAIPVSPLIADEPYMGFTKSISKGRSEVSVPQAYTPDYYGNHYPLASDAWAKYIDVTEAYKPILPERIPLDSNGYIQWVTIFRWIFLNEILLAQLKDIYQEMPWAPEILAASLMGTASVEEMQKANIPLDIVHQLGIDALQLPTVPSMPGSNFMPVYQTPYSQPDWLLKLEQKLIDTGLTAIGFAFRTTMNQVRTRLSLVEDKRFAKFIYMTISYIINP